MIVLVAALNTKLKIPSFPLSCQHLIYPKKIIPLEIVCRAATLLLGSAGFSAGAISPALIYIIYIHGSKGKKTIYDKLMYIPNYETQITHS